MGPASYLTPIIDVVRMGLDSVDEFTAIAFAGADDLQLLGQQVQDRSWPVVLDSR